MHIYTCVFVFVRGRPEFSSFSKEYTEYAGGRGSMATVSFLKFDYDELHFHTGSLKINILEVLFWEGGRGSQKESTMCTLLIM